MYCMPMLKENIVGDHILNQFCTISKTEGQTADVLWTNYNPIWDTMKQIHLKRICMNKGNW